MGQSNIEVEIQSETPVPAPSENSDGWMILAGKSRIDAFTQASLANELRDLRDQGHKKIAIDLRANRFLNLQAIKFCVEVARDLAERGGRLVLISPSEKTKRHFEIYGSLAHIVLVRSEAELTRIRPYQPEPTA